MLVSYKKFLDLKDSGGLVDNSLIESDPNFTESLMDSPKCLVSLSFGKITWALKRDIKLGCHDILYNVSWIYHAFFHFVSEKQTEGIHVQILNQWVSEGENLRILERAAKNLNTFLSSIRSHFGKPRKMYDIRSKALSYA